MSGFVGFLILLLRTSNMGTEYDYNAEGKTRHEEFSMSSLRDFFTGGSISGSNTESVGGSVTQLFPDFWPTVRLSRGKLAKCW
jgi:hypothetical protein